MNMPSDFDRDMRKLHHGALSAVSPQVLARLRDARHAATHRKGANHRWRWALAAGSTAALVLVIAMQLQPNTTRKPALTATAQASSNADYADALTENPDLYLWLASDGQQLAVE